MKPPIQLTVQYFALLQEQVGGASEQFATSADTPEQAYQELRARYDFSLEPSALRYAVNDAFVAADHPLQDGDRLVFIPPVAGG